MKAIISTILQTSENKMWEELQKMSSLLFVASPMLIFQSLDSIGLANNWEVERQYSFRISAFHIFPLGRHYIVVKDINSKKREIFTNECGTLTKIWNHLARIERIDKNIVRYTDEIEISAGILTVFIWLFAYIFYRHRHRQWKILLNKQQISTYDIRYFP